MVQLSNLPSQPARLPSTINGFRVSITQQRNKIKGKKVDATEFPLLPMRGLYAKQTAKIDSNKKSTVRLPY